jgi:hypothetical protein
MKAERPIYNEQTNQWEIWDFVYEENNEKYYELHTFWSYKEAIDYWKILNPKNNK